MSSRHRAYGDTAGSTRRDVLGQALVAGAGLAALALDGRGWAADVRQSRVVITTKGKLRGTQQAGLVTFKNIPYGAPTGGVNRFRPPQPVVAWPGVRDATRLGDQSPQHNPDFPSWLDASAQSEDCLRLNVWAPADALAKLPVMVWLHGGAFIYGSAGIPAYDCGNLARRGKVVAVGINHRLNVFGYSAVDGVPGSGNAGQLDIVAALQWVRDNIAVFGGDPDNVTLFGESGGGGKISALLAMPAARGLFHKAIIESGSLLRVREADDAATVTRDVCAQLGIGPGDVDGLRKVSAEQLLAAGERAINGNLLKFSPVADGSVIAGQPWNGGIPESARGVAAIIGTNHHESVTFLGADLAKPMAGEDELAARAAVGAVIDKVTAEQARAVLPAVRAEMPGASDQEVLVRLATDLGFWRNAVRQSELLATAGTAAVFAYECRWNTPCLGGMWSPHGIELPFIFDHPRYGSAWDGQDSDAQRDAADPQGLRFTLGDQMRDAWVAFAYRGDPSTPTLAWPAYDTRTRKTMWFDGTSKVVADPRGGVREALNTP